MKHLLETQLPVLPLRDVVVFPHIVLPLYVGRPKSLRAIDESFKKANQILLVTQKSPHHGDPEIADLYDVGTIAIIKQHSKLSDGNVKILVEGIERARIKTIVSEQPFFLASYETLRSHSGDTPEQAAKLKDRVQKLMQAVLGHFKSYLKLIGKPAEDIIPLLEGLEEVDKLVDIIAAQMNFKLKDKQELLESTFPDERLEKLGTLILSEIEIMKIDRKIKGRVREQIEKSQRDYYLNEQLSAIHKELGHESDPREEAEDLQKKLDQKDMPEAARERATREIKRLRLLGGHAAEAAVIRTYIDLILDLPWNAMSKDHLDLVEAERILHEDHFGLKEVKERILEFLAVRSRVSNAKAPVICFVGPPGVGKTSLAKSIAGALGRKFERISLGGMRDEAELRGHRRTYIGSMPGKIISAIRKSGVSNPVILLDEIDKVGTDFRGDPASVLLEILDPEQNKGFTDHYLDLEYDLSKVLFITTANLIDPISPPLRDRMEVIRISGYNEVEKLAIAKEFIVPREKKNHGMENTELQIPDLALKFIIRNYTRESGVRSLQREIAKVWRKVLRRAPENPTPQDVSFTNSSIEEYLGIPKFREHLSRGKEDEVGVVTGLAWTQNGGEVLTVEATVLPGKGKVQITGQLGSVMQESVRAALSYIRSRSMDYNLDPNYFSTHDVHVHVPEGAVPKDGPSAGITLATAILSAVLQIPVRREIGMTGEITLRGRVLPIGGLKEKVLAAQRDELKTILYPFENERDRKEIEESMIQGLELIPVFHMDEVIEKALRFEPRENLKIADPTKNPEIPIGLRKGDSDIRPDSIIAHDGSTATPSNPNSPPPPAMHH